MKQYVRDMIQVKQIERRTGRKLTQEELDSGEPIKVKYLTGKKDWVTITLLEFPKDLIPDEALIPILEQEYDSWGFGGSVVKPDKYDGSI